MDLTRFLAVLILLFTSGCHGSRDMKKRSLPGMAEFCKSRKDGKLYPDPYDCRAYIYCSGGYAYRALCGKGLYYDEETQMCDYDFGSCAGQRIAVTVAPSTPAYHTDHSVQKTYPTTTGPQLSNKPVLHNHDAAVSRDSPREKQEVPRKRKKEENDVIDVDEYGLDTVDIDLFCLHREDGRYPHPVNCHVYILCSNSYAYSITCPQGLVFAPNGHGCNFDHSGYCDRKAKEGLLRNKLSTKKDFGFVPPTTTPAPKRLIKKPAPRPRARQAKPITSRLTTRVTPRVFSRPSTKLPHYSYGGHDVSLEIPHALEQAMSALMSQLQRDADLAAAMTGRLRPFRLVQKFLKAKPIVMQLALPGFVIANASSALLQQMGDTQPNRLALLRTFGSPLSANTHRLHADDVFPVPEAGTCPWPRYICDPHAQYRSQSGACNNLRNPIMGRSFTPAQRFVPPEYGDGIQSLRRAQDGGALPSARTVSRTTIGSTPIRHPFFSAMLLQWGQFVDHDLTLTALTQIPKDPTGSGGAVDIECGQDGCATLPDACHPIIIEPGDADFKNEKCLEFVRSQGVPNLDCTMGPREQVNQLTSFLDASMIYGSTKEEVDRIRDFAQSNRGRLKQTANPGGRGKKHLLPTTTEDEECNEFNSNVCYLAGDERVNEHNTLTVMHTMWMREHNRLEALLYSLNPHWAGEKLFQETRKIIGAMVQHITFSEFLPLVLGDDVINREGLRLQKYDHFMGYDNTVDARVASGFAAAAYRFGHSLLMDQFRRVDRNMKELDKDFLSELFFRPQLVTKQSEDGIDGLARGLLYTRCKQIDSFVTKEVTTKLFSEHPPNGLGTDLVSLNIQRARDHGVPGYNAYREWCGLKKATSFDDLTDIETANRPLFKKLYKHVDDIDLFPAGLSERAVRGGLVGPTFACIIGRQFSRLRKGDRFWYENPGPSGFAADQLNEIRKASLAKVFCTNGEDIGVVQPSAMAVPFREAFKDKNYPRDHSELMSWYTFMWQADLNSPRNCSSLPEIDLTPWKQ